MCYNCRKRNAEMLWNFQGYAYLATSKRKKISINLVISPSIKVFVFHRPTSQSKSIDENAKPAHLKI